MPIKFVTITNILSAMTKTRAVLLVSSIIVNLPFTKIFDHPIVSNPFLNILI